MDLTKASQEAAAQAEEIEEKPQVEYQPGSAEKADRAAQLIGHQQITLTEEDNKRILRKTDRNILVVLVWIYFLQILDKSMLGYGALFGLRTDTHLVGNQYSMVGSIAAMAQLAWQPFSSYLIVRVPHRYLMAGLCFGWGVAQVCMAACTSYQTLLVTRFFLGLFEAGCLPLFSVITSQWYRRAEQPIRVAAWYGTNGAATMFAAAVSYGLGQIKSDKLHEWQIQFLFVGLLTVLSVPLVLYLLDNDIPSARFLTDHEKLQAIERLRANQTGTGSREFKWKHVLELALEPKTYLFVVMSFTLNVTAAVTNTFGPIVVSGFGFSNEIASLLNIPFGFLQLLVIFPTAWLAYRFRLKSPVLMSLLLPVLAGTVMLYTLNFSNQAGLLSAYYLLAFIFGGNPLIVSWLTSNTGGTTKKSVVLSLYNAGSSAGNIVGPLLFNSRDAPRYLPGLSKVMAITCVLMLVVGLQILNLYILNRMQESRREANGKPRKLQDRSMNLHFEVHTPTDGEAAAAGEAVLGDNAFLDLTDRENDEFIYVY